jgi:hypothetical protein
LRDRRPPAGNEQQNPFGQWREWKVRPVVAGKRGWNGPCEKSRYGLLAEAPGDMVCVVFVRWAMPASCQFALFGDFYGHGPRAAIAQNRAKNKRHHHLNRIQGKSDKRSLQFKPLTNMLQVRMTELGQTHIKPNMT